MCITKQCMTFAILGSDIYLCIQIREDSENVFVALCVEDNYQDLNEFRRIRDFTREKDQRTDLFLEAMVWIG